MAKLVEHYKNYKWIKVKSHKRRETHSWEDNYNLLERHHIEETDFLINEIRKLAAIIDNLGENLDAYEYQRVDEVNSPHSDDKGVSNSGTTETL